jgi:membrane-associated phospholipid phosphatase
MVVTTLERQNTAELPKPSGHRAAKMRRASPVALLLAGALGCAAAFLLAYFIFVRTVSGQAAENGVVRSAQSGGGSTSDWAALLREGDNIAVLCVAAALLVAIALIRRRFALAVAGSAVLGGSLVGAHMSKMYVFGRPALASGGAVAGHNSFPSGHVTAAMAVVLALTLVVPRRARLFVMVPGALGVAWVASATIALGWHRWSDTVGGCLLVAAVCCLVAAGSAARRERGERVAVGSVMAALLLPAAVVTGGFAVLRAATSDVAQLAAAVVLAAGSSLVVALLVLCLLHQGDRKALPNPQDH